MKFEGRNWIRLAVMAVAALGLLACNNEINKSASPVELLVTNTQQLQRIDLAAGATNCDQDVGSIDIRAILKSGASTAPQTFNDVRITRYRVSYVRTDGGTLVPAPFVRSIDLIVETGGATSGLSKFLVVQGDALTQAPFVALMPQNGGRDPETGRTTVRMDVVVELFGETLAGSNVNGLTRFPLDFCIGCGGCS